MDGRSPLDDQLVWMAPDQLVSSPMHRRRNWGDMAALAESLDSQGVVEPLIGRRLGNGEIELVAGERRKRAALEIGIGSVPVIVRQYTDQEAVDAQLAENLDRGLSLERIAASRGATPAHVRQRLQLCTLSPALRERYLAGELGHAAAFALARLPDHEVQERAADEVEEYAAKYNHHDTELAGLVEQLRDQYMLKLALAPFDITDPALPPYACMSCPSRSGAQSELFADMETDDHCLRPECYQAKTAASWELTAAAARDKGQEVIEGKSAARLFSTYYTGITGTPSLSQAGEATYVLADGAASHSKGKATTWAAMIKKAKADIKPVIAQGPRGQVVRLYPAKLARKARDKALTAKQKPKTETEAAAEQDEKAAAAEKRRREAVRKKAALRACADMGERASRERVAPGLWVAMAQCLTENTYREVEETATARGMTSDKLRGLVKAWDSPNDDAEARGVAVELVARRLSYLNHRGEYVVPFEALATALGIDLEVLEQEALEAETPKKPSKATKAAKAAAKAPAAKSTDKKTPVTKTKTGALVRGTRGKAL